MYDHGTHLAAWADVARSAEENYEPGKLTTFIAYEFTSSMANSENLHRNVIFEGSKVPTRPFSRIDSINPEDLWTWMDMLRDEKGIDRLAGKPGKRPALMEDLATARITTGQIAQRIIHKSFSEDTEEEHSFKLVKEIINDETRDIIDLIGDDATEEKKLKCRRHGKHFVK